MYKYKTYTGQKTYLTIKSFLQYTVVYGNFFKPFIYLLFYFLQLNKIYIFKFQHNFTILDIKTPTQAGRVM